MARRFAIPLAFSVLLAVAAGLLVYDRITDHGERERDARQRTALVHFVPADLAAIEITNDHGTFTLERGVADAWYLTTPVHTPADARAIDGLIDQLRQARREGVVPITDGEPLDLSLFGLDPPRFSVVLRQRDGKSQTLHAGKRNSFNGLLYASVVDHDAVVMTVGGLRYALGRDLFSLRDKRLVVFDPATVTAIEVTTTTGSYALVKVDDSDRFTIPTLDNARADPDRVAKILSALGNLRARRFVSETSTQQEVQSSGLARPTVTAILRLRRIGDQNPARALTIRFAQTDSGEDTTQTIYATEMSGTNRPIIELASSWPLQQLEVRVADLRDKRLLAFDRARVATVTLRSAAGVIVLEGAKKNGRGPLAWSVRRPDEPDTDAKPSEVFALLYKLWSFTADEPTEQDATPEQLAAVGLGDGAPAIELRDRSGASLGALRFGALHGKQRWVTRVGSGETRLAPINRIDALPLHFGAYADANAVQTPGH